MLREEPNGLLEGMIAEACLLLVANALRVLRERVVVGAHRPRGDFVAHAELEHHLAGELGDPFEIVGGPVRDGAEDDLLGGASREKHLHQVEELLLRVQIAVLLRRVQRVAERAPARDDRHLLDGLRAADKMGHERVAGLVVGEDALLLLGDDAALLEARHDPLHCVIEVLLADVPHLDAAGEDGGLVADVREVGARETRGLARDRLQVDVGSHAAFRVCAP